MKFIHDGVSAHIQIAMQMSPCKDGDAKCLVVQMPFVGYVLMQMLLESMPRCECPLGYAMNANVSLRVCYDANVRLGVCHGMNAPLWVCNDANVHVGMS